MEALSKFDLADYEMIEEKLRTLRDPEAFLSAQEVYSTNGPVVRFGWPDWPEDLSLKFRNAVDDLHRRLPFLRPIPPDTEEWNSLIQGWRSDPESAKAIGEAFAASDCFGERTQWVFSRRDRRSKIAATGQVKDLGMIALDITWQGCLANPVGTVSAADRTSLTAAVGRVSAWAGQRINSILQRLNGYFEELYGERFRGLYVFGSYARPDAGSDLGIDSDLDVAVILSDFYNRSEERNRYSDFIYDLSLEYSLLISVVPLLEADFREGQTSFTRNISQYAIPK